MMMIFLFYMLFKINIFIIDIFESFLVEIQNKGNFQSKNALLGENFGVDRSSTPPV
jgi:hypothetical protein